MQATSVIEGVIYCRVSSQSQVKDGHGLQGQEQCCRKYAEKNGINILCVFGDGMSGGVISRDGIEALKVYVKSRKKQGKDTYIIIDSINRWARDTIDHFTLKDEVKSVGGILASPTYKFDDSASGKFMETVLAAKAEFDRNENREQVIRRMTARLEFGIWCFGVPRGYEYQKTKHGKMLTPNTNAPFIKHALEMFAEGTLKSLQDVRRYLFENGLYKSKYKTSAHVRTMLTNILYTGYLEHKPWSVPLTKAKHTPLITMDTHLQIKQRLGDKPRTYVKTEKELLPLRGFLHCTGCDRTLTGGMCKGKMGKKYAYYWCTKRSCSMYSKSVSANKVHKALNKNMEEIVLSEVAMGYLENSLPSMYKEESEMTQAAIDSRRHKIKTLDTKIKRAGDRMIEVEDDLQQEYEERLLSLKAERIKLAEVKDSDNINIEEAIDHVFTVLKHPVREWDNGSIKRRKYILQVLYEGKMTYDKNTDVLNSTFSLVVEQCSLFDPKGSNVVDVAVAILNSLLGAYRLC
jgi:DNA invertase Pin-like site-specific DNA recombinase